jgi:hypothetical protein
MQDVCADLGLLRGLSKKSNTILQTYKHRNGNVGNRIHEIPFAEKRKQDRKKTKKSCYYQVFGFLRTSVCSHSFA